MQPYFYPYIGYLQLIAAVDLFIIADNYQYTKQTWINRNRLIFEGKVDYFSIPVKSHKQLSKIDEIEISSQYLPNKIFARIKQNYGDSEGWKVLSPALLNILTDRHKKLYEKVSASIFNFIGLLGVATKTLPLSKVSPPSSVVGQDRVIAICEIVGATEYLNLPGGKNLYSSSAFDKKGIKLSFLEPNLVHYNQKSENFISHLSCLDIGFSEGVKKLKDVHLPNYNIS